MNAMRYVTPFRTEVLEKISLLSDVSDIIDKWLKVQMLWINLVSVFSAGDIAKAMPTESKKFKQIDKMVEATEIYARDCARLPGSLKSW